MHTPEALVRAAPAAVTPTVRVGSGIVTILLNGEATGGAYAFFDELTDPGGGPPLHVHEREDEAYFILEGRFEFRVGEQTITAGPGDFMRAPRGVPHTFRNVGSSPARKLALAWPAGLERFFLEIGQPVVAAAPASPPDSYAMARFVEAVAKYGMKILAPPA
ncbi:MAG TPA: cupin domain-containing protein [Thermomicrobiales bacterium]|nr:cupin domain-containing protein [Thermomicrobiales bacterium]